MSQPACVTGATGLIGRRVIALLLAAGYPVRVLTRRSFADPRVQEFKASLSDLSEMERFVAGAKMMFHCAAELRDPTKMHEVNVVGTRNVAALVAKHRLAYFCHLSSAGVVGRTSRPWVDEDDPCHPQDDYEHSKLQAEQYARQPIAGCRTLILRPTNVVDADHLAELALPVSGSAMSRLKAVVKGAECAHIVHADDVARAGLYFADRQSPVNPGVYFVSLDGDANNTVAHLWSLYSAARSGRPLDSVKPLPHLPLMVPHLLRHVVRRTGNPGSVRYSSKRLLSEGFTFSKDVATTVAEIARERVGRCNSGKGPDRGE